MKKQKQGMTTFWSWWANIDWIMDIPPKWQPLEEMACLGNSDQAKYNFVKSSVDEDISYFSVYALTFLV